MTSSSKTDSYLLRRMNCRAISSGPFGNDIPGELLVRAHELDLGGVI